MLILIQEDGSGKSDANSYANVMDGDAYHDGHLYATAWTAATAENKAKALVFATRLIDAQCQFNGVRAHEGQALQWPREGCHDPDGGSAEFGMRSAELASDRVPRAVVDATCELARELLIADRTAAPPGEGLKYFNDGAQQTGYDKSDKRPILPAIVQAMLSKFGSFVKARSGSSRLIRT